MATLLAQQGSWSYLVDAGEGPFEGKTVKLARVYERLDGKLLDPWPLEALLARGYWGDVTDPRAVQKIVAGEVDDLLAA